jgi:pyruvate/2-oxoglutarate dehydrogenase complex dihydrolipoamide acyltransferase (E2) component
MTGSERDRVVLRIPQAAVTMTEGTIVEWVAADGEAVAEGQVVYRLETEKVEIDVESPVAGVLRPIGAVGETYPVGEEIGFIDITRST